MSQLSSKVQAQWLPTRDPADGKAQVEELIALKYNYSDTGADLEIQLPASADMPILITEIAHGVLTAFSGGTPAVDIGDGSTADLYIAASAITEATAGNFIRSTTSAKYLTAAAKVKVTLSASLAAGVGVLIVKFIRVQL